MYESEVLLSYFLTKETLYCNESTGCLKSYIEKYYRTNPRIEVKKISWFLVFYFSRRTGFLYYVSFYIMLDNV